MTGETKSEKKKDYKPKSIESMCFHGPLFSMIPRARSRGEFVVNPKRGAGYL
jgi:hypothetical protein